MRVIFTVSPSRPLGYPERVDKAQARRWIASFEAVAEADRQALRGQRPDPAWAIALSLSMVEAAERMGHAGGTLDPLREAEDDVVRAIWVRLRRRDAR